MALNIKQISHISKEYVLAESFFEEVFLEDDPDLMKVIQYVEIPLGKAIKIGYMCEEKAKIFPIYLEIDGEYKKFQIGKTRIFEVSDVEISGVRIPNGIKFTVDYISDN